jgi:hypothetical protein
MSARMTETEKSWTYEFQASILLTQKDDTTALSMQVAERVLNQVLTKSREILEQLYKGSPLYVARSFDITAKPCITTATTAYAFDVVCSIGRTIPFEIITTAEELDTYMNVLFGDPDAENWIERAFSMYAFGQSEENVVKFNVSYKPGSSIISYKQHTRLE